MIPRWLLAIASCFSAAPAVAGEVEDVAAIAKRYGLAAEVVLADKTRVDLLNDDYAIEADWSVKFAEAIGQALSYAEKTGRKPGILLIRKTETSGASHREYMSRCLQVCKRHGIHLWEAKEGDSTVRLVYPPDPFREGVQ